MIITWRNEPKISFGEAAMVISGEMDDGPLGVYAATVTLPYRVIAGVHAALPYVQIQTENGYTHVIPPYSVVDDAETWGVKLRDLAGEISRRIGGPK